MGAPAPGPGDRTFRAPAGVIAVLLLAGLLSLGVPRATADQPQEPANDPFAGYSAEVADDPFAGYEEVEEPYDPLEIPNRIIFAFNQTLDFAVLRPAAVLYREVVPRQARDAVRNLLRNLRAPVILANDLLQGELDRARTTARRFAINSTAGLLGLFDVADGMGYAYHDEDFGQTLGSHGAGEGFYIVLPLLGPSNVRDATGLVVDHFLDPWTYVADEYGKEEWNVARAALTGLDLRSRNIETLDEIQRDSIDFYARIRSLYSQHRDNLINNGAVDSVLEPTAMLDDSEDWLFSAPSEGAGSAAAPEAQADPAAGNPDETGGQGRASAPSEPLETAAGLHRPAQPPEGAPSPLRLMAPAAGAGVQAGGERPRKPLEESGIYRRVTPPPAPAQTDPGARQSGRLPAEAGPFRHVMPPPGSAQTARAERADARDRGAEGLGGLW